MHGGQVISIFIFFCNTPSGAFPTHFPCSYFDFVFFVCSPTANRIKIRVTPKRFLILLFFNTPQWGWVVNIFGKHAKEILEPTVSELLDQNRHFDHPHFENLCSNVLHNQFLVP